MKNIICYLLLVVLSLSVSLSSFSQTTGGSSSGSDGGYISQDQYLPSNHACTKVCRVNMWGREGGEKFNCRVCLEKYSVENGGDLKIDWSKIPDGKPNKYAVQIPGVTSKTIKPGHELEDCVKEDDGQKISCPDGVYVKTGSVVNSMRSSAVEGRGDLPKKNKAQKNQGSANEQ